MRKPKSEEWEYAWDTMRNYCQSLWNNAKEGIDIFDPRIPFHQNSDEPEGMNLFEIVAEAEPGEKFKKNNKFAPEYNMSVVGVVCDVFGIPALFNFTKEDFTDKTWYFTKRHKRCPECGRMVEE